MLRTYCPCSYMQMKVHQQTLLFRDCCSYESVGIARPGDVFMTTGPAIVVDGWLMLPIDKGMAIQYEHVHTVDMRDEYVGGHVIMEFGKRSPRSHRRPDTQRHRTFRRRLTSRVYKSDYVSSFEWETQQRLPHRLRAAVGRQGAILRRRPFLGHGPRQRHARSL